MSELEARLFARFPWLADKLPDWGFECGVGWERLIAEFLVTIEEHAPGGVGFRILQVKEKFSTLCFYYRLDGSISLSSRDAIKYALVLAEGRSAYTCEKCGARGRRRDAEGYIFVACDEHAHIKGRKVRTPPETKFLIGGLREGVAFSRYDPDVDAFVDDDEGLTAEEETESMEKAALLTKNRRASKLDDEG